MTSYSPGVLTSTFVKSYSTGNVTSTVSVEPEFPTALNPVLLLVARTFFSVTTSVKNLSSASSTFEVSSEFSFTEEISPLNVFTLYLSLNV